MKLNEILKEGKMKELQTIIDDAEAKAFDQSAESKSSVSGNAVLKHAVASVKALGLDGAQEVAAIKTVTDKIAKEYGRG